MGGLVIKDPDDELSFGCFLESYVGWRESLYQARVMYSGQPKLLKQATKAVCWNHLKQAPSVQAAMALDPALTRRVEHGVDFQSLRMVVTFTDRQAAMLFKLTWVG